MESFTLAITGFWQNTHAEESSPTRIPVASTEEDFMSYLFFSITKYLRSFYLPTVFLLGTFGNVMTIIIMQLRGIEKSTFNIYFTALAVADTMYLTLTTVPLWLSHLLGYNLSVHILLCKIHTWLNGVTGTISCWCLVCMTVHRAMSVVWPHRVNLVCTRRTVYLLISGITIFSLAFFSHFMIGGDKAPDNNGTMNVCMDTSEDYLYFLENIFIYVDVLVYCFLPFIFLVVANSVLVWKLTVSVKTAGRHLTQGHSEQVQAREKAANSITLTVIVVSMAFLVLTLPNSISLLVNYSAFFYVFEDEDSMFEMARILFIHDICYYFSVTNGAVNFYLYCLTGRRFREEFINVMCCGRNRRGHGVSSVMGHALEQSATSMVKTDTLAKHRKN